jgi:hypothetical protein
MAKASKKAAARPAGTGPVTVMVGTRKGAFLLRSDARRAKWSLSKPIHLGSVVHHVVLDPRDRATILMASSTGHMGHTIYRSTDRGRTWKEAARPPAYPKAAEGAAGRTVDHVFWLTPGHASERGVWWAGVSPQGLFRSADGGVTWEGVSGYNDHPMRERWTGGPKDLTPDGGKTHSILVDPRDRRHMYLATSGGGVFESADYGADWKPLNRGCEMTFNPDKEAEFGHDPHDVKLHPLLPDRLYQQNHCGVYRMDRPAGRWERIGRAMPKNVGDIGFPIVLHPRDPDVVWVFPMDGTSLWPRTSPGGRPAVFTTRNGGRSWTRLAAGLPARDHWWTVKRQAMCCDSRDPVGLYFGTTSGDVWASRSEGARWTCLARGLPHVYSVTDAEF